MSGALDAGSGQNINNLGGYYGTADDLLNSHVAFMALETRAHAALHQGGPNGLKETNLVADQPGLVGADAREKAVDSSKTASW